MLNNENEWRRAFELGADGVMTDFPSKFTDFLNENPSYQWEKRVGIDSWRDIDLFFFFCIANQVALVLFSFDNKFSNFLQ